MSKADFDETLHQRFVDHLNSVIASGVPEASAVDAMMSTAVAAAVHLEGHSTVAKHLMNAACAISAQTNDGEKIIQH